jgi:VWFA-related protein
MSRGSDAGRVAALSALLLFVWAGAWAQGAGEGTQPTAQASPVPTQPQAGPVNFSASSELVLVPVVVTDKSSAPVLHLRQQDFRVFEDGREQVLKVFDEARPEDTPVSRPARPANEFTNVLTSDATPRRLEIIALDLLNTPFMDQPFARQQLIRHLAQGLRPGTLVSLVVIHPAGIRVIHDFTSDPAPLIAALQKVATRKGQMEDADVPAGPRNPLASGIVRALQESLARDSAGFAAQRRDLAEITTLEALQSIAQAYAGVPGRKALVWATAGFPFLIAPDRRNVSGLYQRTLQLLSSANISVYPVDLHGLLPLGLPAVSEGADSGTRNIDRLQASMARNTEVNVDTIATMKSVAEMTGGRAFYNRNDLSTAFLEASQESSAYYMLGYYLDPAKTSPGWHKLKVEVLRKGVEVRSRSGFFVTPATAEPERTRAMEVSLALQSPLDYTSLPLTLRWTGSEPQGEKRRVRFEIILAANSATVDESDVNLLNLELVAVARTEEGKDAAHFDQAFRAHLKPEALDLVRNRGVTYQGGLELGPGQYTVRFVMRDNLNGKMGSLTAPLQVK